MRTRRALSRICSTSLLAALFLWSAPARGAPQVEASLANDTVSPGNPFRLTVIVSWQGDADEYIIAPPEPELPEGIEQVTSSFASSARQQVQRMRYTFVLRAVKSGSYSIQPLTIQYWARGQTQESTLTCPAITFRAERYAFVKKNRGTLTGAAAACIIAGLCAGFFLVRRRKAAGKKEPTAHADSGPAISRLLHTCRTCRLKGDYAAFYEAAVALADLLAPQDGPDREKLAAMLEKVRFGGLRPPADEPERLLRQLEKSSEKRLAAEADGPPDYQKYCR